MPSLVFSHVFFSYTSQPLLEEVSFSCGDTERLCIVGPNGSGKSTILRLARRELSPERGTVSAPEPRATRRETPALTVGDILNDSTAEHLALLRRFDELNQALADDDGHTDTASEYDQVLARMTALDVWSLEASTGELLAGLGLADLDRNTELPRLSPGQRGRLDLAGLLLSKPEQLVLDEPTNHLDDEARSFLADTLIGWEGPVLFASHDRSFIDEVATGVLDLDTAAWDAVALSQGHPNVNGIHLSRGNYSDYLTAKQDARNTHREVHERQQAEKSKLVAHRRDSEVVGHKDFKPRSESKISKKFYADRAQTVSTRRKNDDSQRLDRLAEIEVRKPREDQIEFSLPATGKADGSLAVDARAAYITGRMAPVSCSLSTGEHLLVTGPNGSGKSTLLRWINDRTPPTPHAEGSIDVHLASVLLPQDLPQPGDGLVSQKVWDDGIGEDGKGFLHPRFWATPVADLSDGNQRRVQLALVAQRRPELLIVDEPTNYLDLAAIESLERALHAWDGTLIVATHDQWLIDHWGTRPRTHLESVN